MYVSGEDDRIYELGAVPQSSVGAPLPLVLCDEFRLILAYYASAEPPGWDPSETEDPVAVVSFESFKAVSFGPPNDEAFSGHPLASRGLEPYAVFEVKPSGWIRSLERMNRVHPAHRPELYDRLRHFVFAFHDSTFECIATDFSVEVVPGPIPVALDMMKRKIAP